MAQTTTQATTQTIMPQSLSSCKKRKSAPPIPVKKRKSAPPMPVKKRKYRKRSQSEEIKNLKIRLRNLQNHNSSLIDNCDLYKQKLKMAKEKQENLSIIFRIEIKKILKVKYKLLKENAKLKSDLEKIPTPLPECEICNISSSEEEFDLSDIENNIENELYKLKNPKITYVGSDDEFTPSAEH